MRVLKCIWLPLVLCACASNPPIVSPDVLRTGIRRYDYQTLSLLRYAGTRDGFHYLFHSHTFGGRMYRIDANEFQINSPYAHTGDRSRWRAIDRARVTQWLSSAEPRARNRHQEVPAGEGD